MNNINLEEYGYNDFYKRQVEEMNIDDKDIVPARVIEVHKEQYKVISRFGEKSAKLKGSLFYNDSFENEYPTVGDFVLVKYNHMGDDVIYEVLKRKSKFSRLDSWNLKEQIVAANFDYVFIVVSMNYDFNIKRIERYIACAWQSGGTPVIILTKCDLCSDYSEMIEKLNEIAFGIDIFAVSSYTGYGIDKLKKYIKRNKTLVLLGSSGVGKSSLTNTLAGKEIMKVNDIREDDSKGRHTTTHRQMIFVSDGNMVIDTPGMREMGLWDAENGMDETFSDIEELAHNCKFSDCTHNSEPGCAVRKALQEDTLSKERFKNYLKLQKEVKFAMEKEKRKLKSREFNNRKKKMKLKWRA